MGAYFSGIGAKSTLSDNRLFWNMFESFSVEPQCKNFWNAKKFMSFRNFNTCKPCKYFLIIDSSVKNFQRLNSPYGVSGDFRCFLQRYFSRKFWEKANNSIVLGSFLSPRRPWLVFIYVGWTSWDQYRISHVREKFRVFLGNLLAKMSKPTFILMFPRICVTWRVLKWLSSAPNILLRKAVWKSSWSLDSYFEDCKSNFAEILV